MLAAAVLTGLLALPLITSGPVQAQARDISNACEGAPETTFIDRGNEAQAEAIDCIAGYEITQGQTATSYGTANPVRRDQMASFLVRKILLIDGNNLPAAPAQNQFPCDVEPTNDDGSPNPHYENIQRLAATTNPQIAQGGPGGRPADCYGPLLAVTRGQMATFIVRQLQFLDIPLPSNSPNAFDDDDGTTHEANINIVAALGVAQGTATRQFDPTAATTRGQMAFFLSRDLSVLVENNKLENPFDEPPATGETSRPELVSAAIVGTTTTAQQTPANPAGTRVRFVFDEDVQRTGAGAPDATEFFIHDQSNARFAGVAATGVSPTVESDNRSVVVNFPGVATTEAATALTLATVDDGAVRDTEDNQNTEGDAPIGTAGSTTTGAPGVTSAPDLIKVSNFRPAADEGRTAVDFTFDQPAFRTTGANAGAFALVLKDATERACTAPASASTTPSGTTSAGGEGTATFTVICENIGLVEAGPAVIDPGTAVTANDVARGSVERSAVASTTAQAASATAANQNPLQVQPPDPSTNKSTVRLDLVSVAFTPGTGTARDAAVYTFDGAVNAVGAANLFAIYQTDGKEVAATAPGGADNPTIGTAPNQNQVRVTFPQGTLTTAVGANVRDGAVEGSGGNPNEQDEVGAGTPTTITRTPGQTTGPNLTGVALSEPTPGFGFRAVYTFDEAVTLQNAAQAGAPTLLAGQTLFHLFAADGTRYTSTTCTVGSDAATNTQVTCTAFNAGATAATSAQIAAATLGTVDFAAVFGAGGAQGNASDRNPEGAASTTGGTA